MSQVILSKQVLNMKSENSILSFIFHLEMAGVLGWAGEECRPGGPLLPALVSFTTARRWKVETAARSCPGSGLAILTFIMMIKHYCDCCTEQCSSISSVTVTAERAWYRLPLTMWAATSHSCVLGIQRRIPFL